MTYASQYRLITVEFLSTFVYRPRGPDYQPQAGPQQSEISFRLCGFTYDLSLAEFGSALGLHTEQDLEMPIYTTAIHTTDDAVVSAWWPRIDDEPFVHAARVMRIRDPLISEDEEDEFFGSHEVLDLMPDSVPCYSPVDCFTCGFGYDWKT
ncbi:hypothetical protein R6Q57_007278 [Mikania cordata]